MAGTNMEQSPLQRCSECVRTSAEAGSLINLGFSSSDSHELLKIKGVSGVHHIHVRSIDGYNNYATLHVVVSKYSHGLKEEIKHELEHLGIGHSTVELELNGEECDEEECEPTIHAHSHKHSHH